MRLVAATLATAAFSAAVAIAACSSGPTSTGDPATIHPDAACVVAIDQPKLLPAAHVPIGTHVIFGSNPPSSGAHYPVWAAYQTYSQPVDRRYYVHDLEHGAIVLLYRCDDPGGCPETARALALVADSLPDDPLCNASDGTRVRAVVTPDPGLDVPVAAAAWGFTYRATCVDLPTLKQFARDHYGQGPEATCAQGTNQF